jgi:hypothetical protein
MIRRYAVVALLWLLVPVGIVVLFGHFMKQLIKCIQPGVHIVYLPNPFELIHASYFLYWTGVYRQILARRDVNEPGELSEADQKVWQLLPDPAPPEYLKPMLRDAGLLSPD